MRLTEALAARLIALGHVTCEYPHALNHVLDGIGRRADPAQPTCGLPWELRLAFLRACLLDAGVAAAPVSRHAVRRQNPGASVTTALIPVTITGRDHHDDPGTIIVTTALTAR
jgi:hypothetical protein